MKRRWMTGLLMLLFLILLSACMQDEPDKTCTVTCLAATPAASASEEASGWWESLRGSLPEDIAEEMRGIERGDVEMGFEYLFSLLAREIRGESGEFLGTLFILLGVTALGAVAGMLFDDASSLKRPLGLLLAVVMALTLWQTVSATLTRVWGCLDDLTRFSEGMLPAMTAILAGGGATGSASVGATGLTAMLAILEVVVGRVLAPLIAVCFAFSLVSACSEEVHIDGITATLRWIYMTVVGVVGMLATGALTLQSVMASAADSMAMRTARYTVGNMIPMVGGTIGAALGTLGSSLTVIKSSIGVGALVACGLLVLPLLVSLFFTRLSLNLSASLARMMQFRTGEKLLTEFRGVIDMTLAVTALSGTLFIIYIAVFIKTALPFAS